MMGSKLICPRQRLILAKSPPAMPDSAMIDTSAVWPFAPRIRKLPIRIADGGCSVQPFGVVHWIFFEGATWEEREEPASLETR